MIRDKLEALEAPTGVVREKLDSSFEGLNEVMAQVASSLEGFRDRVQAVDLPLGERIEESFRGADSALARLTSALEGVNVRLDQIEIPSDMVRAKFDEFFSEIRDHIERQVNQVAPGRIPPRPEEPGRPERPGWRAALGRFFRRFSIRK